MNRSSLYDVCCAEEIAKKVDTTIILSGDSDYIDLLRQLKGEAYLPSRGINFSSLSVPEAGVPAS